ncbi:MAG: hypothetical protein JOZ69_17440, partial [Myxococcales bacterium]|nr:hypothetical protein [Myxococcales bacterium]
GQPPPYAQPHAYGQPPPYAQPHAYGQPPQHSGHAPSQGGTSSPYGPPGAHGVPPAVGAPGGYGTPPPHGASAPYGAAPGQAPPYPPPPYGQPPATAGLPPHLPPHPPYAPPQSGTLAPATGIAGRGATPVGALIQSAFDLYRKNLSTLLVTVAVLFVPIAAVKAGATALVLAPTAVVDVAAKRAEVLSKQSADLQRRIAEAQGDPNKTAELLREQQKAARDLQREWATTGTAVVSGLLATLLGLLAMAVGVGLMYFFAVPLVTGALTILVADRATGGTLGPGQAYRLLLTRLGKWASAWIPAFLLVLLGLLFLVIPGLLLGFFFVFVTPVVILEGIGGVAALQRSASLVKANFPQVAIMWLLFIGIRIVTSIVAGVFLSAGAFLWKSIVQDMLQLFLLPIPVIGTVLLYLDIRRQADGLDDRALRAGVDGLRAA